jgi:hypothetical protein
MDYRNTFPYDGGLLSQAEGYIQIAAMLAAAGVLLALIVWARPSYEAEGLLTRERRRILGALAVVLVIGADAMPLVAVGFLRTWDALAACKSLGGLPSVYSLPIWAGYISSGVFLLLSPLMFRHILVRPATLVEHLGSMDDEALAMAAGR